MRVSNEEFTHLVNVVNSDTCMLMAHNSLPPLPSPSFLKKVRQINFLRSDKND